MSYHNTTHEPEHITRILEGKAENQEAKVLDFMRENPGVKFSPEQINAICLPDAPLTSVRRALSNLTYDGKIHKAGQKVKGQYGRMIYTWYYKLEYSQLEMMLL